MNLKPLENYREIWDHDYLGTALYAKVNITAYKSVNQIIKAIEILFVPGR